MNTAFMKIRTLYFLNLKQTTTKKHLTSQVECRVCSSMRLWKQPVTSVVCKTVWHQCNYGVYFQCHLQYISLWLNSEWWQAEHLKMLWTTQGLLMTFGSTHRHALCFHSSIWQLLYLWLVEAFDRMHYSEMGNCHYHYHTNKTSAWFSPRKWRSSPQNY